MYQEKDLILTFATCLNLYFTFSVERYIQQIYINVSFL